MSTWGLAFFFFLFEANLIVQNFLGFIWRAHYVAESLPTEGCNVSERGIMHTEFSLLLFSGILVDTQNGYKRALEGIRGFF
jgi:hypothetical protein